MRNDGYEKIGDDYWKPKSSRPTAMQLIQPREGQHRTLWCEIPEVVCSGILSKNMQLNICAEG
jgi:neuronal guanine nucleotide exchange factor